MRDPLSVAESVSPYSILKQAIKAVPAVKYALGVGGIIAVIAIVKGFGVGFEMAAFGTVGMIVLMTVLVLFASVVGQKSSIFYIPALILTWFCLFLFMAAATLLVYSEFFVHPLGLTNRTMTTQDSVPTGPSSSIAPSVLVVKPQDSAPSEANQGSPIHDNTKTQQVEPPSDTPLGLERTVNPTQPREYPFRRRTYVWPAPKPATISPPVTEPTPVRILAPVLVTPSTTAREDLQAGEDIMRRPNPDFREAITKFDDAIRKDPGLGEAFYHRAVCHEVIACPNGCPNGQINDLDELNTANEDYTKAYELEPTIDHHNRLRNVRNILGLPFP